MKFIDLNKIHASRDELHKQYQSKSPHRYLVFDNILNHDAANAIYASYPEINEGVWNNTTYLDQKNKFQKRNFEENSFMQNAFDAIWILSIHKDRLFC